MELFTENAEGFYKVILAAQQECTHPSEEEGGIILEKNNEFKFIKVINEHKGTPTAIGLYAANQKEIAALVLPNVIKDQWKFYASFHTHPRFSATPSMIDHKYLFEGFRYNIIYSIVDQTFSFNSWTENDLITVYISLDKFKNLLK